MRADERLLEVIVEQCQIVGQELALGNDSNRATAEKALREIGMAAGEMRRRGDTLVRRDDLRRVLRTADYDMDDPAFEDMTDDDHRRWSEAYGRLEIALGGKLR
jgi:hypothetical protein